MAGCYSLEIMISMKFRLKQLKNGGNKTNQANYPKQTKKKKKKKEIKASETDTMKKTGYRNDLWKNSALIRGRAYAKLNSGVLIES
jgi:hypothetical protein